MFSEKTDVHFVSHAPGQLIDIKQVASKLLENHFLFQPENPSMETLAC